MTSSGEDTPDSMPALVDSSGSDFGPPRGNPQEADNSSADSEEEANLFRNEQMPFASVVQRTDHNSDMLRYFEHMTAFSSHYHFALAKAKASGKSKAKAKPAQGKAKAVGKSVAKSKAAARQ